MRAIYVLIFTLSFLTVSAQEVHIYNINSSVEKLINKSEKSFKKGKKEKAIKFMEQAHNKAPGNVQVMSKLAQLYYTEKYKLKSQELFISIKEITSDALLNDNDLSQVIKDELQLILDSATKKIRQIDVEFSSEEEVEQQVSDTNEIAGTIRFDMSDPNVDDSKFLTNPKPLNASDSYQKQVKKVKNEVLEQYGKIEEKGTWYSNDFSKILEINNDWLRYSAISKLNWFSGLKIKEKEFLSSLNSYEILRQQRERLLNTRTIVMGEIDNLDIKTRWANEKRIELQGKVQTQLKEELKGKLSAIPKSIVLVGRTKMTDERNGLTVQEARTKRNQKLIERMQKEAIALVGGQKIEMYSSMKDNDLKQFFSTTTEGTAQTIDNYYKDLNIEFRDQGKFTYLISRIEVFPLDNSGAHQASKTTESTQGSGQTSMNTTVYRWVPEGGFLENCSNSRDIKDFTKHKFKIQEKNYLDFQSKFSESLNERYKSEIEKAGIEYDQNVNETNRQIDQTLNNILAFNKQSTVLRDSLSRLEELVKEIDEKMKKNRERTQHLENAYQVYYKSKNTQINKLVIESSMGSNYSARETFAAMVDKTLGGLEDIRKKSQSLVVYKEVSNAGETFKANEQTVEFEPVLRRFRILSMNKFEDEDRDIFYSLNVAYDVGWNPITDNGNRSGDDTSTPISDVPKKKKKIIITYKNPEEESNVNIASVKLGADHLSEPQFKADGSFDLNIDGKKVNVLIVEGLSSKVSFIYSDYSKEWRLPNEMELKQIFKLAAINKGTSSDFIQKKFKWQSGIAAFLTSDTEKYGMSEISNKCLELSRSDYSIRTDKLLDDEGVYLLLIRK